MDKITTATFKMDKGDMVFRLYEETPIHTGAFINNAKTGQFKGIEFYRVEPNFVIQSGPKEANGRMWDETKPPRRTKDNNTHFFGVLSSANSGPEHSSIGVFFISLGRWRGRSLDEAYTSFGHIIEGWEHLEKIEKGDIINDVIIREYTLN
jgi:cyclophilin family peptidyl-prolyl cis-trans isomerase